MHRSLSSLVALLSMAALAGGMLTACGGSSRDAPQVTSPDSAQPGASGASDGSGTAGSSGGPATPGTPIGSGTAGTGDVEPPRAGGSAGAAPSDGSADPSIARRLDDALIRWHRDNPLAASAMAQIESPSRELLWTGAIGVADRSTGEAVTTEAAFRVASVSKTFIAAAVHRLAELGRVGLDDPVSRHLLLETTALLRERGYDPDVITVRHLLQHTSGVPDFDSIDFVNAIVSDPQLRWTRREQLVYGFDRNPGTGAPGQHFAYTNNGYNLLGEIIEQNTSTDLGTGLRDLIGYERIGLTKTWLEALEPAPAGVTIAHAYDENGFDLTRINPTADAWGAGGLVSTVADLNRFIRALLEGRIVSRSSLASMQSGFGPGIGSGLFALPLAGRSCWGHEGFWGTAAYYCEDIQTSLTLSINFGYMGFSGSAPATLSSSVLASRLFAAAQP